MKAKSSIASLLISMFVGLVHAQGVFQYDQQSADEDHFMEGSAGIQSNQLIGQSFTPTLTSIGFIRLYLYDATFANTVGGTLLINVRTGSIDEPILSSTELVSLPPAFGATVDFFFSTAVALTPGITYYFQPVVQSGNSWGVNQAPYNYAGGTAFFGGVPDMIDRDLWFREGIVVPEPASVLLVLFGAGFLGWTSRRTRH